MTAERDVRLKHAWVRVGLGRIQDGLRCTTCGRRWLPTKPEPLDLCPGHRKDLPPGRQVPR